MLSERHEYIKKNPHMPYMIKKMQSIDACQRETCLPEMVYKAQERDSKRWEEPRIRKRQDLQRLTFCLYFSVLQAFLLVSVLKYLMLAHTSEK